jgi:hypothetical protein
LAAARQVDVSAYVHRPAVVRFWSDFGQIFGLMLVLSGLEIFRALERLK